MVAVAKNRKSKEGREPSGFGARLRQLREAAGLTQEQLGERAGMPYQSIAKYERGAVEPTWPNVVKLAKALGVEPNDFQAE
jgi:transcriptional regulator with XRE-family HTH domain